MEGGLPLADYAPRVTVPAMNAKLEIVIDRIRNLPDKTQIRLAEMLPEVVSALKDTQTLEADLTDAGYRSYVESELQSALEDIRQGRVQELDTGFDEVIEGFRARHEL